MKALDRGQTPYVATPDTTDEVGFVQVDADGVARDARSTFAGIAGAVAATVAVDPSLSSRLVVRPTADGTANQVLAIESLDPLVTKWKDDTSGGGGGGASRVTFSNAAYTITATDSVFVAQTGTLSAARTVTLPAASSFTAGAVITVVDESGTVTGTNKIVIARAGSDTINGAATSINLTNAYGARTFVSDGSSKWTSYTSVSSHIGTGSESMLVGDGAIASATAAVALGPGAQATATYGIGIGYDARATAQYNLAIGGGSRAISGTTCMAIGYSATAAGGTGTMGIGYAANATGVSATAVGNSATAAATGAVLIGASTNVPATETDGIAIGRGANITVAATGGGENIAIGGYANAGEWRATAIGFRARATAISATAIGRKAYASATHSVAIGRGAWINAANAVAIGWSGGDAATDVFFESGHTHKYVDEDSTTITRTPDLTPIVIHGFDAFDATGSPTNNVAGGPLVLAAGRGTGTAIGGSVKLQVAPAGGVSNNTKNTLVTVVEAGCSTTAPTLGFFAATPVVKPTGVAVTAAGVHAALVSLGLIAA